MAYLLQGIFNVFGIVEAVVIHDCGNDSRYRRDSGWVSVGL